MPNAEKTAAVAEITDAFRDSSAAVLTEYRGLSVAQLKELRRSLSGNATYAVVKNTLTKIAMADAGLPDVSERLTGPTAIAFVTGDPVIVAKGLRDFARTHPLLVVKGGVLDGRPLSAEEVRTLADLESREVLLARMAGAMKASLSQAVALFAAPLSQVARLAAALQDKATEDPSILSGGAGVSAAPSAAEPVQAVPPTDAGDATGPDVVSPDPVTDAAPVTDAEPVTDVAPATDADPVTDVAPEPVPADAVADQPPADQPPAG